jgi:hypothetical protein
VARVPDAVAYSRSGHRRGALYLRLGSRLPPRVPTNRELGALLPPKVPVVAVTATATRRVEQDMREQIGRAVYALDLPAEGNQQLLAQGISQRWGEATRTATAEQGTLF